LEYCTGGIVGWRVSAWGSPMWDAGEAEPQNLEWPIAKDEENFFSTGSRPLLHHAAGGYLRKAFISAVRFARFSSAGENAGSGKNDRKDLSLLQGHWSLPPHVPLAVWQARQPVRVVPAPTPATMVA
jgi:hypothetical protein